MATVGLPLESGPSSVFPATEAPSSIQLLQRTNSNTLAREDDNNTNPSPLQSPTESEFLENQIASLKLDEEIPEPVVDPTILTALSNPRDRFLLLRAEVEIERFLSDPRSVFSFLEFARYADCLFSITRLPLSPPYFPPLLNSYQRLLIHRLADSYGIKREVEPGNLSWSGPPNGVSGSITPGVVVLVKGETFKL